MMVTPGPGFRGHEVGMGHLQQGHENQQGQWDQEDQQDPGRESSVLDPD